MKFWKIAIIGLLCSASLVCLGREYPLQKKVQSTVKFYEAIVELHRAYANELKFKGDNSIQKNLEALKPKVKEHSLQLAKCDLEPTQCDYQRANQLLAHTIQLLNDSYQELLFSINSLSSTDLSEYKADANGLEDLLISVSPLTAVCRKAIAFGQDLAQDLVSEGFQVARKILVSDYMKTRQQAAKLFGELNKEADLELDASFQGKYPGTRDICAIYKDVADNLSNKSNQLSHEDWFALTAEALVAQLPPEKRPGRKQYREMLQSWKQAQESIKQKNKSQSAEQILNSSTNVLIGAYLHNYQSEQTSPLQALNGEGGNCQIQTAMIASVIGQDAKLPQHQEYVVQMYSDHIRVALWDKKQNTLYDPITGKIDSRESKLGKAPILKLSALEKFFLDKLKYNVPAECKQAVEIPVLGHFLADPKQELAGELKEFSDIKSEGLAIVLDDSPYKFVS